MSISEYIKNAIIRVGIYTNYNYTAKEKTALLQLKEKYNRIFVNSNSITKIRHNTFPVITTINSSLDKFIKPTGKIENIVACRIKYVKSNIYTVNKAFNQSVQYCIDSNITPLITYMRFRRNDTLSQYSNMKEYYYYKKPYHKIKYKPVFHDIPNIAYCNYYDLGCNACKNCTILTYNDINANIASLDLQTSGYCKYKCPDCFAKYNSVRCGISFDKIKINRKQDKTGKFRSAYIPIS